MAIPTDRRYTKEHEWAVVDGDVMTVGITDYAQDSLGEIVFVELPEVGAEFSLGDTFGVVESVKAVSDLYVPASGKIVEVNSALTETPEKINADPYGEAWMIKLQVSDETELENLLDAPAYEDLITQES
ncbi:MAG: glycine cleavage system protein GcvH [Deltaproteobacteria bacterium]|nr:glycine cleavage system protein GcvH [bacterium]MCB9477676.1 glycine cleavage system protein GcvH [Deltaproteobacteria bacterium]MCB9479570.1 glycine cleavage system protein GcvH [Deltaproteobacteria bacterium]MCB9488400.1 glycine cleavage system protein GcvH [Deltaproteobacteria bacterium]